MPKPLDEAARHKAWQGERKRIARDADAWLKRKRDRVT